MMGSYFGMLFFLALFFSALLAFIWAAKEGVLGFDEEAKKKMMEDDDVRRD